MEELDIATITKRSIHGVFALVSRTFFIQIINVVAYFLFGLYLSSAVFGIFFVVSAIIAFLSYFSDIGLAAALIQKKEPLTHEDLKTTFTIQQAIVISIVIIALALSNVIGGFYKLEDPGIRLFQALVVAFFFSSLKTIPSIILERDLHFQKLVVPQIVETIVFNAVALVFAIKGFGITSFTFAVLARGLSGLIVMYLIAPWKIAFGYSKKSAKQLLSFGMPFQLNSILALLKDDMLTIYLGRILPLAQVGYIGFAQKWAFTPLRAVMDNVIRITFPSFSRLANDKNHLARGIEKSLFATSFLIFPSLFGLIILSPYFVNLIPKYKQWEPALLSLTFFCINGIFSSISTPLTNALNAIGKVRMTLYLMVFWTSATWVFTPIAIGFYGFNGVALASAIIAFSAIGVVFIVKRYVDFNILRVIRSPFLAAVVMAVFLYFLSPLIIKSIISFILMVFWGLLVYALIMLLISRKELVSDIKLIRDNLKK